MSAREMLWRVSDRVRQRAWARRQVRPGSAIDFPAASASDTARFSAVLPHGTVEAVPAAACARLIAEAHEIMSGSWEVLGVVRDDVIDPDWFVDPLTRIRAPQSQFCFAINYRDPRVVGNVKQVWELSRFQHATVLAAAYAVSGDPRYAERVGRHLRSWWAANPFLSGVHWTSGIEIGLRLISWVWIRRLLEGWSEAPRLFEANPVARQQICWHQQYLAAFRSRGSSANNHVIAEAAGQLVGALAFPWFAESDAWADAARTLLTRELANNTFPSGVNREMAFEYHGLVAELVTLAAVEADLAERPLGSDTWATLTRMLDVVAACVDVRGQPPRQGDGDDGHGLVIDARSANRWEELLAFGRTVIGAPDWWPEAEPGVAATMLAAMARPHPRADRPSARPWHFADAGLTIIRSRPEDGAEMWCRLDAGPHGFLSIAAHAHADALSVEVRYDGVDILADPGTYCYGTEPQWRRFFRSTVGHNTLELDGEDQSVSGGPTMWMRHARTEQVELRMAADGSEATWSARHDGYESLQPPAVHRRTVQWTAAERRLHIEDSIISNGPHRARLAFHLGPTVEVDLVGSRAELSWRDGQNALRTATLHLPAALAWSTYRGCEDPVLGWYSPSFGRKVPATMLLGTGTPAVGMSLESGLEFHDRPGAPSTRREPD